MKECEPNFPEGTKVKLIHYDPSTGQFVEHQEEIVHRKNSNSDSEKDGV